MSADRSVESAVTRAPDKCGVTGQFLPGNKAAVDHPGKVKATALRKALIAAVNQEDVHEIMRAMIAEAISGNVFAANLVLDRTVGKVQPAAPEDAQDTSELLRQLWEKWANPSPAKEAGPVEDAEFRAKPNDPEPEGGA